MYEIPQSICINGVEHPIRNKGDYRMVLDCFEVLNDSNLSDDERSLGCLMIFYGDIETIDDIMKLQDLETAAKEMQIFFNCGQTESPGMTVNYKLIDWKQDSQLICSAINKVSGKEIRFEPYMHWWTFMGYYLAIGESPLSHIVGIRSKMMKGKKLEKHEQEFKRNNPQYFTWDSSLVTKKEDDKLVKQLWNSGK